MKTKNENNYSIACERTIKEGSLTVNNSAYRKIITLSIVSWLILSGLFAILMYFPDSEVTAAPIFTSGTKPTSGEIITGNYTFEVNDNGSATRCELRIDDFLICYMDSTGSSNPDWNYSLDTSGWSDGTHLIRYDSIGGSGGDDVTTIPVKFDNNGPEVTNRSAIYDMGCTAVSAGNKIRVKAMVTDSVSGVNNVTCNATSIGGLQWVYMYDDGQHQDGSAFDNIYGSDEITVSAIPGYHAVFIWARDNKGNYNNVTVQVDVDNYEPTIREIQTILPAGQTGVKNGDQIRVIATAFDFKLEIIDVIVRQPLDVVLVLDNSGSMGGTDWTRLETAATSFVDSLADDDRCAIYSFWAQDSDWSREKVYRYQDFLFMDQVSTCKDCNLVTDIGRNLTKHVILSDDGDHLTGTPWNPTSGQPGCNTPIWDTIGEAIMYAQNNHLTTHAPVVVAMTDGNDHGSSGYETGSETFCPGAPPDSTGRTWSISGGCYWGSPVTSYSSILKEYNTNLVDSYTTITFSDSENRDGTRVGLINCSIPVFTIGLGINPQGSNNTVAYYIDPDTQNYKYTTEYDLREIGNSSNGGNYYYAPTSNQLNEIYQKISQEIEKFGIQELGKAAPHGIQKLEADLSTLGIIQKVSMFDDGKHGDASANDDIYGSDLVTINSFDSGNVIFSIEGTDIAGNANYTINSLYLDNIQPAITNITAYYPPGRTMAQDGYSIYFSASTNDTESGIGYVYLDASNIGGSNAIPMNDVGNGYDEYAHDGVFTSNNFTVATGLKSGTYTITIKSYDTAGNLAQTSGNIEIYNDVDIIMGNLVANEVIFGNFPLIVNISDPDGIQDTSTNPRYRIDANPWYDMSLLSGTNFGATINTSKYLDGAHSIYVNAKDPYGAESTLETKFVIDNTAPSQATIITPIQDEFMDGVYSFKCTATDAIGMYNVTITIMNDTGTEVVRNGSMGFNSGTGYYEFVLGTTSQRDGTYKGIAYAHDRAGHETASAAVTFNIDNNNPSLTLNHPQNSDIVWGIVEMNITVIDTFLDSVEYNVDNSGWVDYLMPWNTTKLNDGSHTVKIRARDKAGHEVLETIYVTVDNHYPVCLLTQPANKQYIGGIFTLRAYASDEVGILTVKINISHIKQINATNFTITEVLNTTMVYNSGTGYYEYNFDTTVLPDGNYSLICCAEDIAENVTYTANVTFYIDNHAPKMTINDPLEGNIVSGLFEFNITIINETFLDSVRYNIDGSGWVDISVLWNTTKLLDGTHTVKIRAFDFALHITEESLTVIVDNNNPKCNVVAPISNQYVGGIFTFKVAASDLVRINRVVISVFNDMVNATYNTQTSCYEYGVDTTVYSDGSYTMSATVYDTSAKSIITAPVSFHVDNHPPVLTLNSPNDGQFVFGEVSINVSIMETFNVKTQYNVDGKGWTSITTAWDTTVLKDGEHTLHVRTVDDFGYEAEQIINVIVDNHDPVCIIQAPIENQYIKGEFTFRIVAMDEVGIDYVNLSVFYGWVNAIYHSQSGYYEYSIETRFLEDGIYNVSAICVDLANRSTTSERVEFRVDNTYPDLQVNAPLNGIFVSGLVKIDLKISDAFPCVTEYNLDGNGWIPYQVNPVWNSSSVTDGEHILELRTTDPSGHTKEHKLTLFVDNHSPTAAIHSPAREQFIEGTFTFKILALDELGIDRVVISVFDEWVNATYNSQSNYFEYTVATSAIPDGIYNVTVSAFDNSGKKTMVGPTRFNLDNNDPILTINSPLSNDFVSGKIQVDLTVIDIFPTATYYNVDGSGWVSTDNFWATNKGRDGEHTLEIKAVDSAGHVIEQLLTVNVDNTPPKISIVLPKENDYISGRYMVSIYAADTFGVETVMLSIDLGSPMEISQNPSTGLYELPIDTTKLNLVDGLHVLRVEALDKVFQTSNDTIKIYIDNSPPRIKLDYPARGEGRIDIVVNASDLSKIEKVLINIDGTDWREMNIYEGKNNTYRYIWRTTTSDNGYHIFDVKTKDILGNEEVASGEFFVSNEKGDDPLGFLLEILPLIVFIVVIILILIVFILFRRGTFSAWLGRVEGRKRERENDRDQERELDEELDEEDEFDFEFARMGAEDEPEQTDNRSFEKQNRQHHDAGIKAGRRRHPIKNELNTEDMDWFEEEKPPNMIGEQRQRSTRDSIKRPSKREIKKGKARRVQPGKGKKRPSPIRKKPRRS